ncbi:hypothetical protein M9Y10_028436 [Tritrichomonas musculus]|uniref:Uncharacterized protein n=1 Tax=Tritrichomonas musculus TaxID=1915356 RepID=A0ABR2KJJ5_9EUKA
MDYKASSDLDDQSQLPQEDFFLFVNHINVQQEKINYLQIANSFENIRDLYINNKDEEALECLSSLELKKFVNDPYIFHLFNAYNIASILLYYVSEKFDFSFNLISISAIIDFSSSIDDRYISKFIHLSISNIVKPFFNQYNLLTPFALLEISYVCYFQKSLKCFKEVGLNFSDFFRFLFESHGRKSSIFMKSFSILISIFDPLAQRKEIIIILGFIDEFIKKLPIPELSLYVELLNLIVTLTKYSEFYEIISQTELVPDLIDLLYKVNDQSNINIEFVYSLLSLISFFSQDENCPEIKGSFLFDLYFNFNNPVISTFIFYIIGNLCKYQCKKSKILDHAAPSVDQYFYLTNELIQKGFVKEVSQKILYAKNYLKLEALTCFSKMISYAAFTTRTNIIKSSGQSVAAIMGQLVDSLFFDSDDTAIDRILGILCLFEDAQKTLSDENIASLIEITDLNSIQELNLEEDEKIILDKLKLSIENFYDNSNYK